MSDRDNLKVEATDLGLEFKGNISNVNLKTLIEAEYTRVAAAEDAEIAGMVSEDGGPAPIQEAVPASPAMKTAPPVQEEEDVFGEPGASPARKIVLKRAAEQRARVADARRRSMQTRIVTITNKDNRENDVMTTVYLSFENQYFGISKLVPLDVPVELEAGLIKIAAATTMTLHKDEIVNGHRTGNKVPVTVKKFAVSYAHQNLSG